jgi:hypothetical protein
MLRRGSARRLATGIVALLIAGDTMNQSPFTPGPTGLITLSGTSQPLALGAGGGATGTPQVVLALGTPGTAAIAYIKFGTSAAVTAAATDFPILPNTTICLTPPVGTTHIAGIGSASGGTLYVTVGHGVLG